VFAVSLFAGRAGAEDAPLPLPRFASLKGSPVYMREGPSTQHRVKWVYHHKGTPMEIVQVYDVWRRVRDVDGETGWMHVATLSGDRTIVIRGDAAAPVRRRGDSTAPVIAEAQPGAIGTLETCSPIACEVDFGDVSGWVERARLWGVYGNEQF
jgi:SH3-like domain-containing protein